MKKILVLKKSFPDAVLTLDIASSNEFKQRAINSVYEVLFAYGVSTVITEINRSKYKIEGLMLEEVCDFVLSDIEDYITQDYTDCHSATV